MEDHQKRFETLDAMRGVAALAVVLFHCGPLLGTRLAPSGYLAVDMFFVLSGFVVAHAYDGRLRSGMKTSTFAWYRICRFWPLLALGVLIGAFRASLGIAIGSDTALSVPQLSVAFVASLFFLPAPLDAEGNLFILNVPLWTLLLELLVNVAYATLYKRLTVPVLVVIAIVGGLLAVGGVVVTGSYDNGATTSMLVAGVGRTIFGFSVGALLYRARPTLPRLPLFAVLLALGFFLLLPVSSVFRAPYDIIFAIFLAPLMVLAGAASQPGQFWRPICGYLGVVSFVIYALHAPILEVGAAVVKRFGAPPTLVAIAVVLGLLIAAPFIDRFYDKPVRAFMKRARKSASPTPVHL